MMLRARCRTTAMFWGACPATMPDTLQVDVSLGVVRATTHGILGSNAGKAPDTVDAVYDRHFDPIRGR